MTFKLMTHTNQHGFGVSLVKYDEAGDLIAGFVLNSFDTKLQRIKYLAELAPLTGFTVEHMNDD